MVTMTPAQSGDMIDARPVRPTANDTPWDQALAIRDQFAAEVRNTLAQEKLRAAVFVSPNGNFPPWVSLEAWLPTKSKTQGEESRERASLSFVIDPKPYHEHPTVVTANLRRGRTAIGVKERPDFPPRYVAQWVRYALDRGPKPSNYTPKLDAFVHFLTSFIPIIPAPHSNKLMREYRASMTAGGAVGLVSFAAIILGGVGIANSIDEEGPLPLYFVIIAAGVIGLIVAIAIGSRRKRVISVISQSQLPPRSLARFDSWQAVVSELGADFENVKRRLIAAVSADAGPGLDCEIETYTFRTPNGYEQRERLVVTKNQGMVHVHIYDYGQDLFVGWTAYVNWLQWGETKPVAVKVRDGQEIQFLDLRPATYVPNDFDLIDLSSLSEYVHRRLEREIKALLKDKAIDQEIDFKIIRGDRARVLDQGQQQSEQNKGGKAAAWSYKS